MSASKNKIFRNTTIVSVFTLISRVFGYIRDAAIFIFISNATGALDAFFVAFRIPNFFRRIFGEGALSIAYIPVLTDYKENKKEEVKEFVDSSMTTIACILLVVSIIGVLLAPILIYIIAPGFINVGNSQVDLAVQLLQITFPYMFFICLVAVAGGILNTYDNFSIPAITPVLMNLILIFSAIYLAPKFEEPVLALAIGVLVSGFVQLAFQIYPLMKIGLLPKWNLNLYHSGIKKIKRLMLPVIVGSSVTQINLIFDTIIASFLITGSIGWLYISDRFLELPLAIFGVSIATVMLPKLSMYYSQKNEDYFNKIINWGLKLTIVISIPTMTGLIMLSEPILISLLQYREFSLYDVNMTSVSLIAFAAGLPAMIGAKILIPAFYSRQNTTFPVRAAIISVIFNFVLNIAFVIALLSIEFKGVHMGLAMATSISAYINFYLLFNEARKKGILSIDKSLLPLLFKTTIATIVMIFAINYFSLNALEWSQWVIQKRLGILFSIIISSIVIYLITLVILRVRFNEFDHKHL
ncbi:MAG: murein biosynthesis integral membrane protein MurJ [Pseudomonadota bacterium]|nr:murein biosynthesis integral membrane protein MurJ [Pseudomonadota bacterium]